MLCCLRQGNRSLASFLANGGPAAAAAGTAAAGGGSGVAGGKKTSTLALYRARMETWGMLRLAFSAARVALSRSGIVRVATKCFMGEFAKMILISGLFFFSWRALA